MNPSRHDMLKRLSVSRSPAARAGAFTLVELLVCIAIIGILAALVFPVVGLVKGKAMTARCASNLRQCGTAVALYAADHKGFAPSVTWTLELQPYLTPLSRPSGPAYTNLDSAFPVSCPSLPYDDSKYGRSTYSMNSWLDTDHSNRNVGEDGKVSFGWHMPLRNVEAPARKIMMFDGRLASTAPGGSQWAHSAVKGLEYVDFRHQGDAANILFVDGHVNALKAHDIHEGMWPWEGGGGAPQAD